MSEFDRLRRSLLAKGELYEDADFPCSQTSVYYHQTPPCNFIWKRPQEIVSCPQFLSSTGSGHMAAGSDLVPGRLGDQWLVSAMATVSLTRGLFYRVVPADQSFEPQDYAGIFRFRFWWLGEWREVVIDDRLPTVNGKLAFTQSVTGDTFWAPLLEKAFAKLHGSYEALKYGSSAEGLADLTGGATESLVIRDDPQAAWLTVQRLMTMTTIVTAIISSDQSSKSRRSSGSGQRSPTGSAGSQGSQGAFEKLRNGLMVGANYRILAMERIDLIHEPITLLRLAHPLGMGSDYTGPFSQDGREWVAVTDQDRMRLESIEDCDDEGQSAFWISWHEFVSSFSNLEIVYLDGDTARDEPSLRGRIPMTLKIYRGIWRRGVTSGGCRNNVDTFHSNPQLEILIPSPVDHEDVNVVCLSQHSVIEPKVVGFSIYATGHPTRTATPSDQTGDGVPLDDPRFDKEWFKRNKSIVNSSYTNSKQVTLRYRLDKGSYLLVPTTFEPGQEGLFNVRIYSRRPVKLKVLDCPPKLLKPPILKAPSTFDSKFVQYEAMFMQLADEHKSVNAFELQELLEVSLPNDYVKSCATIEVCRQIITSLDATSFGRLIYKDYKNIMCSLRFWQNTFKNHTKGTSGILRVENYRDAIFDVGFQLSNDVLSTLILKYMRKDCTLRFGDFVLSLLHLTIAFKSYDRKCDKLDSRAISITLNDWLKATLQC
ncbi:Calpain-C [Halotydeus destructor]|nr:Calpain-C [Halotydeus destructor]